MFHARLTVELDHLTAQINRDWFASTAGIAEKHGYKNYSGGGSFCTILLMVRFLTSCILALAAAASTALADRLPDDIYHVIYFPGIPSIPHFLTLDTPQGDATFNPTRLTDERAGRQLVCLLLSSSYAKLTFSPNSGE